MWRKSMAHQRGLVVPDVLEQIREAAGTFFTAAVERNPRAGALGFEELVEEVDDLGGAGRPLCGHASH